MTVIIVAAAIIVALGVLMVVMPRRWMGPVIAVVLFVGVVATVVPAYAQTNCPPAATAATSAATTAATTAPTVAPTSTPPPMSSTTTTSSTTTVAGTAPTANGDDEIFPLNVPFTLNVLTNDDLGSPPATISSFTLASGPVCAGVSFDQATGVLSGTLTVLLLPCLLSYTLQNAAGSSSAVAAATGGP
jgi:hypothetical protein